MEGTKYVTKAAILKRALEIKDIPLRDVDQTGRLSTGKGAIGTVIEESWFGYHPNSESEPDFPEAGVELKVTPYVHVKQEIRAKERLVCNIINYMEEYKRTFETSSFLHKCQTMLLMAYEYFPDIPKGDFSITEAILFSFPEKDLVIIKQDWERIIAKIRAGKADELSERDTLYLAACTKGANAQSVRKQPFSDNMAKQRAYSLKSAYMTQVLRRYVFGEEEDPQIIKSVEDLQKNTFEEYVVNKVRPFYGKTLEQLKAMFGVDSEAKNINEILLAKMLDVKGRISATEEFQKANIIPKTIRLNENGTIKEHMSFPYFDFIKLSKETEWEESKIYNYFAETKFMFVIFRMHADGSSVFEKCMFWTISDADLLEVEKVWARTITVLKEGVVFRKVGKRTFNNLPKASENHVAHVRPHARNNDDRMQLPDGRSMPKQCFWLNNTFIAEQIKDETSKVL